MFLSEAIFGVTHFQLSNISHTYDTDFVYYSIMFHLLFMLSFSNLICSHLLNQSSNQNN